MITIFQRGIFCLVTIFLSHFVSAEDRLWLISPAEVEQSAVAEKLPKTRTRAIAAHDVSDAPSITLSAPQLKDGFVDTPIRIVLSFQNLPDSEIDPASFRAYYGMLKLDVTQRLLKHVSINKYGMNADNIAIPSGSHRLFLRITDTKMRTGETEFQFKVR